MSANFWISPVSSWENRKPEEVVQHLIGKEKIYALRDKSHGRKVIKPEDWICFYVSKKGVCAHAKITTFPERKRHVGLSERFPWVFSLEEVSIYDYIAIDKKLLSQLEAFKGRDLIKPWSWFIQSTRRVSHHDFEVLVQHKL
jgi:hypothetical protein